ncbi:unnamed protein product [marine sediment metagenome]|uniref:Uncharacterized protein n=1 Tax=marine sediment metagenome TaxID=412755 RepID=X1L890_9ZZZZ
MANKAAIALVIGLGAGIAGIAFFATKAKAAEPPEVPEVVIPTPDDIMAAKSMGELEVYYMYIGELFITGKIDTETYEDLYDAYVVRFHQLTGVA